MRSTSIPDAVFVGATGLVREGRLHGIERSTDQGRLEGTAIARCVLGEPFHVVGTMHWYLVILPRDGALVHQRAAGGLVGAPTLDRTGRMARLRHVEPTVSSGRAGESLSLLIQRAGSGPAMVTGERDRGAALVEAADHGLDENETLERTGTQPIHRGQAAVETDDPVPLPCR